MVHWVKAGSVENRFQGDRIAHTLNQASIPFVIKSYLDTAYNGLFIPQKGWGVVLVPDERREEAEQIVSEIRRHFEEGKDEIE